MLWPKNAKGTVQVGLDGGGQGFHQRRHALEGGLGRARFAAGQADGAHGDAREPPSGESGRAAAGIGKAEQPRAFGRLGAGEPGGGGRAFAQQQGQQAPLFGGQGVGQVDGRGGGVDACRRGCG